MNKFALGLGTLLLAAGAASGQWEPDVRLTENDSVSSVSLVSARNIAAEGEFVYAVWNDDADQCPELRVLYARSSDRGLTWSTAVALPDDSAPSADASVAVEGGRVHVAWFDVRSGLPELYYKGSSDGGTTWSSDRWLTADAEYFAGPCIAVSGPTLHLAWTDLVNDTPRVRYKRSPDFGVSWGPDVIVSTTDSGAGYGSVCALDSDVHVAWNGSVSGSRSEAFYRRSTDGGLTWQPAVQLTSGAVGPTAIVPQVAASGELVHIVCCHRPVDKHEAVYLRSPDRGLSWSSAHRLFSTPGEDVGRVTVAADRENVHVAASLVDGGTTRLHYRLSTDGGMNWESPIRLSEAGPADKVSLAVAGRAVYALWRDSRDGNEEIYFKRNLTGNAAIEEKRQPTAGGPPSAATVVRGTFLLHGLGTRSKLADNSVMSRAVLLNAAGRKVLELRPGANDVGRLSPGVFFARDAGAQAQVVRKVMIVR